jgi:hypothetical protein
MQRDAIARKQGAKYPVAIQQTAITDANQIA